MSSPTGDNYSALAQARRDLNLHLTSLTHAEAALQAGRLFESEDKNGKLLANLVTDSRHRMVVSEMLSDTGGSFTDPSDILNAFQVFFQSLYHEGPPPDLSSLLDTLRSFSLLSLSTEEAVSLYADTSVTEIAKAINSPPQQNTQT